MTHPWPGGEHLPIPGILATLRFRLLGRKPKRVTLDTGQAWDVREVVDEWQNPDRLDLSRTQVAAWYVLRLGDLYPGDGHPDIEVRVTSYSDRPGWWIELTEETGNRDDC